MSRRTSPRLHSLLLACCTLALLAATPGDEREAAQIPRLDPGPRRVLLVMIDGLPTGAFERALDGGDMPRLATLLASRPTLRTTAFSTFPSATSPSVPELLSGRYCALDNPEPGAVHAFDREERRVVRYVTEPDTWKWPAPNLFDAARLAGLASVTVFEGRWDGPRSILTRAANFRDAALEVAGITEYDGDRGPVEKLVRELRGPAPPPVGLLVFNAVDLGGHFHGPDSPEVRTALMRTDALLGEVLTALADTRGPEGRPRLADTTLLLFGDHGMVQSGTYLDLQPFFQQRGLKTFDASSVSQIVFRERLGKVWTQWPDVLLVSGGSNITQVYFRASTGGWSLDQPAGKREAERAEVRPDPSTMAAAIAELPGVAQVLRSPGAGEVEVLAAAGRYARVVESERDGAPVFAYLVPAGANADPFGYLADPSVAPLVCREGQAGSACYLRREEWIRRTLAARYPGAPALLGKAFDPARFAGDLMVTALPGYSFLRGQKGDHGNLEREAMLTPLVLNGPGVDPARLPPLVRLIDIYPTAAVLLGASPLDPALLALDGHSLVASAAPIDAR
ncbi:MAG TPA: alkaline phosphatase family protein [Thermoanaerobaculia bacterium]|nr:alkaline phosphatase family protein [Thermoanaerobaculia bacterium]